ncbi:type II secretion system major pseudopilin GspG [Maricaulis parjimensis]|uniref:type II secretion system major pseudopilin GspG n=1 Tax=Maricaulis parjimensis TaxID=144023 RepID=UPI001EEE956B|nr:type II secretion system major pseudopilin GspG [Maricaulis parjimensis]
MKQVNQRSSDAGITLFEILVVMVIIALLATIVAPRVIGYVGRSKVDVAEAQMASIATSLELYYLDMGQYPDAEEGLVALVEAPEDNPAWQGPYFSNVSGLTDPWGRPYGYALNAQTERYILSTLGRDGEVGGDGEDRDLTRS